MALTLEVCPNLVTDWPVGQRSGPCDDCQEPRNLHPRTETGTQFLVVPTEDIHVLTLRESEIPARIRSDPSFARSCHCSSMFNNEEVFYWFIGFVAKTEPWSDCSYSASHDVVGMHARDSEHFKEDAGKLFSDRDLHLYDVGSSDTFALRLIIKDRFGHSCELSGRPDFVVCTQPTFVAQRRLFTICIIEIESGRKGAEQGTAQLLAYMVQLMNVDNYGGRIRRCVLGAFVEDNGTTHFFKAVRRQDGGHLYFSNGTFHMQHLPEMVQLNSEDLF